MLSLLIQEAFFQVLFDLVVISTLGHQILEGELHLVIPYLVWCFIFLGRSYKPCYASMRHAQLHIPKEIQVSLGLSTLHSLTQQAFYSFFQQYHSVMASTALSFVSHNHDTMKSKFYLKTRSPCQILIVFGDVMTSNEYRIVNSQSQRIVCSEVH